jgi:hypothetical protein
LHPLLNQQETAKEGREIYDDEPHVKIATPGEQKTVVFQPADEKHKRRFPQAWAAFQARQQTGIVSGTPLTMWPPISKGQALTLIAGHIMTVEALAGLGEETLSKFPQWIRDLNAKAAAYLKMASDSAASMRAEDEKSKLQATIEGLQAQINQLQEREQERQQRDMESAGGAAGAGGAGGAKNKNRAA